MSQTQTTLGGDEIEVAGDRAAAPADAEERTTFGAYYRDESGDRRFSLHRCPACLARVNSHRWARERDVQAFDVHLEQAHDSLEDFGEGDVHDDQRKLPIAAGVLR